MCIAKGAGVGAFASEIGDPKKEKGLGVSKWTLNVTARGRKRDGTAEEIWRGWSSLSLPSQYMHALSDTTPVQNLMLALSPSNSPIASLTFNGMVFGSEAFGDR